MKTHLAAAGILISSLFGACPLASAGSIIQSFTLPGNAQSDATQWTYTDSSTQLFNPTLGTLDDIIFTISASATATSQLTDNNPGDQWPGAGCSADSYTFSTVTDFHLKDGTSADPSSLPLVDVADAAKSESFSNVAFNQAMNGATSAAVTSVAIYDVLGTSGRCADAGPGCLETGATVGTDPVVADVDPLDISDFMGVGNKTYTVRALTSGGWFGPPSLAGAVSGTAVATVTIEYDFSPNVTLSGAPEPASFALFGSALACLGVGRRLKNRLRAR